MLPWLGVPSNASSAHREGRAALAAIESAREAVAKTMGWDPAGVLFTSGATEANATVLGTGRWAVSAVEHPSVLSWGAERLPVDENGVLAIPSPSALRGFDGLSLMWVNNESGTIQPVAEAAAAARAAGVRFHVDASQAPGKMALARIDADFVTLSAHKCGGPQGVGAILFRRGAPPANLLRGGGQERGSRPGTQAVAPIVGMGAAFSALSKMRVGGLRDRLEAGLLALGGRVAGGGAARAPNTTLVGFEGVEAADLVIALDLEGIAVSAGSACASGSPLPSHVLAAMGFSGGAVRFSLGPETTLEEIEKTLEVVERVLRVLRF